jgi:hypothetical protein
MQGCDEEDDHAESTTRHRAALALCRVDRSSIWGVARRIHFDPLDPTTGDTLRLQGTLALVRGYEHQLGAFDHPKRSDQYAM